MRAVIFIALLSLAELACAQSAGPKRASTTINFSSPRREYTRLPGALNIYFETAMTEGDRKGRRRRNEEAPNSTAAGHRSVACTRAWHV
ncbi:MAG TPA: hypothetical protein VK629_13555 [Steroidobacteraceae bacterium]|nr:hypothetical protein [Steroidobacteraceae bacterium]